MAGLLSLGEHQDLVAFAHELCLDSGEVIQRYFRSGVTVERKADQTPVTVADREAERLMRDRIEARFPDHGIVGEEFGVRTGTSDWTWILDPIDGTVSFVLGIPMFGTLIALAERVGEGEYLPRLGLIHQPILGQLLVGDGEEARLDGKLVGVRSCASFSEATLLATDHRLSRAYHGAPVWDAFVERPRVYRAIGDCMGYFQLATGYCDVVVDSPMHPWDFLPLTAIVRGAGGTITSLDGGEPREGSAVIATAGPIHAEVLASLRGS